MQIFTLSEKVRFLQNYARSLSPRNTCTNRSNDLDMYGGAGLRVLSYTAARNHLAETMEQVCDDHTPVVITRQNERSVVMMSLEDYQALDETAYLLRSPKNAERLLRSIAELEPGGGTERELIE
jgi:antitoxin YefM